MPFRVTYIHHDCFVVRVPGSGILVFDYWKDPRYKEGQIPAWIDELAESGEPVLVLVSHHHKDHFVREIFEWSAGRDSFHYILSKDTARMVRHCLRPESIWNGTKLTPGQYDILKPGEETEFSGIYVNAYGSTDIGNSYVVTLGGLKVFHAGDLNAWIWLDESTPKEAEAEMSRFRKILQSIASDHPELDIAMMPVDSRLGRGYETGAAELVRKINVRHFFPMHFGLGSPEEQCIRVSDAIKFNLYANPERGDYIALTAPGAVYLDNNG